MDSDVHLRGSWLCHDPAPVGEQPEAPTLECECAVQGQTTFSNWVFSTKVQWSGTSFKLELDPGTQFHQNCGFKNIRFVNICLEMRFFARVWLESVVQFRHCIINVVAEALVFPFFLYKCTFPFKIKLNSVLLSDRLNTLDFLFCYVLYVENGLALA